MIIEADVRPTESVSKVARAVLRLFPDARIAEGTEGLVAEATDLEPFRERLRAQRIRAAAREQLRAARQGSRLRFRLNKQAAWAGVVNFGSEGSLGDLEVTVEADEPEVLIDRLTAGGADEGGA